MLFWNRWNQESAGRVYFNISTEKPAHTPDTLHAQTSLLQTWMDQSETLLLFFLETSQRQSCSRVPQSSWSLSSTCAEELWVEIASWEITASFYAYGQFISHTPCPQHLQFTNPSGEAPKYGHLGSTFRPLPEIVKDWWNWPIDFW